ncbi:excinuclease ABC subunit UvrC [Desulfofundulus thermosubterraneus]|uniref:UvrABC system protein C n=1 Tax=Desulfofundulus thermosubterraneus DSM 16057 TaxID=1121432 RepID=A0A1M6C3B0_9FIRM|nr:excinuclease ABC subunit UvrC [Desulfofundulus thermosubterraneus]SHI55507.1 Excinuclease ABC subunit C [Desulfofundulus thermosubterraneus DSM 16057]
MTPEEKLQHLPDKPGVYLFRDTAGEIIYVGKAVSLKNRVRSYYQSGSRLSPKVRALMNRAADFEYIVTDNEVEALILESNLIKEHRPRYNIYLKDDKSYPYLRVTLGEDFPRVHVTRRVVKDGSRYFGPYTSAGAVHETLDLLRRLFPFRTCKQKLAEGVMSARHRPCLNFHIGRCLAPCSGQVGREEYRAMIREICLFLEGRQDDLVKELTRRMNEAADKLEFERAARLRDQLQAVRQVLENQKVLSTSKEDRDVVALAQNHDLSLVMIFFVRGGKLIGRDQFLVLGAENTPEEVLTAFVKQYYVRADFIPGEILLAEMDPQERPAIEEWLSGIRGARVRLVVPRRGEKKQLVDLAAKNALLALQEVEQEQKSRGQGRDACAELARELGLENIPYRIECFDISNTQGEESVASMVVFEEGRPAPGQYRRFKIRTVSGPNDFASLKEVLTRRFTRAREERELIQTGQLSTRQAKFYQLPNLVIVDGGKGQLSAVRKVMKELGFAHIPAFGLAKEEELLFAEGRSEPIRLPRDSRALHLLQHLRDEAHRFAVTYHRQLRTRRNLKSLLDEIEGIGPVRRRALLKAFPSLEEMARATVEELAAVPGMNRAAALAVYRFLRG